MNTNYSDMTLSDLQKRADILKDLCHRLDPYEPLQDEDLVRLKSIGIHHIDDPFHLTNTLILYVEDTLEEISKRKQLH